MNSKWHLYISFVKSIIRIAGCMYAVQSNQWVVAVWSLIIAEMFGVFEEIRDER